MTNSTATANNWHMTHRLVHKLMVCQIIVLLSGCMTGDQDAQSRVDCQIVVKDSADLVSFEHRNTLIRYMSDDGIPKTERLTRQENPVSLKTNREYLEFAVQDNETVTQYFVVKSGGVTQISMDEHHRFKILQPDKDILPYDENYPKQRNMLLFNDTQPAIEELLRFWSLLEANNLSVFSDNRLLKDLSVLKQKAIRDIQKEKRFLDSLQSDSVISAPIAEYYRLKIAFDNIKIETYPSFTIQTLLEPLKALDIVKPSIFNDLTMLTFYNDWMIVHYKYLYQKQIKSFQEFRDVYNIIKTQSIPDNIQKKLLLIHVLNACSILPSNECRRFVDQYKGDTGIVLDLENFQ